MSDQCGSEAVQDLLERLWVVFLRLDTIHVLAKSREPFFKSLVLFDIRFHEPFDSSVGFDIRKEVLLFVVVVGVDSFVDALAEDHEVCYVFGFRDLLVL